MVSRITLLFVVFITNIAYAQVVEQSDSTEWLIMIVSEEPSYNGDLIDFIQSKIQYPEQAVKEAIAGTVVISFWIDTTGITYNHKIIKGVREDLNEEALRVSRLIKFDKPAYQKNKPIRINYTVPIEFCLEKQ